MSETPPSRSNVRLRVGERSIEVEPDRIYIIGSDDKTDLRLRHGSVAPHHAMFSLHRGEVQVEDLDSPTGTWVAGTRIDKTTVPIGTTLRIGEIDLEVADADAVAVAVAETTATAHVAPDAIRAPVGASRRQHWRESESFADIMAAEIRRAPWFTLSILLHAIVLWLLYVLWPIEDLQTAGQVAMAITEVEDEADVGEAIDPQEEEVIVEQPDNSEELQDLDHEELRNAFEAEDPFDEPSEDFAATLLGPEEAWRTQLRGGGGGDILSGGGGKSLSKKFGGEVGKLRATGLEIMFVFDSTGSMDPVIQATKKSLLRMLEALHALVPDRSRVGIVTYRDRGRGEQYLTRAVPLSRDYYRPMNFMHTIEARGGGDRPEAIYEGLKTAFEQKWRRGARRVVVLIGDAPAHEESERQLRKALRDFTRGGRSHVHTIMTSSDILGVIEPDTRRSFKMVAKDGGGQCVPFENEESILRQVLSLAFGRDYRQDIDEIYRRIEARQQKIPTRIRDIVRRADGPAIERELRRAVVDDQLVRALASSRDKEVARLLLGFLTRRSFPEPGRQAAAWALQRMLDLEEPPIHPDREGPISSDLAHHVQRMIRNRS